MVLECSEPKGAMKQTQESGQGRLVCGAVWPMVFCLLVGCSSSLRRSLPDDKVLLGISLEDREHVVQRLGFTYGFGGHIARDSRGRWMAIPVTVDTKANARDVRLVVITATNVYTKPWSFGNRMGDDGEIAIWHDTNGLNYVRSGERLPASTRCIDASGEWVLVGARDRRPWLAKLETPFVVAAEPPESNTFRRIFAHGDVVHTFARRGWRKEEGPLRYLVYDFDRPGTQPLKEVALPWGRAAREMDPESGLAVVTGNQRAWALCWLMNVETGKRERIPSLLQYLIVRKEVAQKWIELTKR